jgi:translation initiation factor 1
MAQPPSKTASNPFAKLAAMRDALPPGEAPAAQAATVATAVDPVAALLARRVVVRRERKGRGGKTVTLVQCADGADGAALDALAKELRKALGTAAQREEGAVAVQGDIADRVADWLKGRGAGRIVRGD